ncbi:N-acetyl sugar amidotransferase [Leptospira brenneri]|uniref:N-acetyl sugar amidotransferase n=1 Tax=Leptospira brenneri TaxID=2023182 RepID=A0A2M9Y1Q6_9LEPT|nr:N-acetyl sugar amidotransferase [Leptospira brenneri]PJZ45502.1 LPS biosynthesis protein [Leptospira brenneri]TGK91994.1 N-acetyl sugar amidotransferase [Leptospira brenneri]
MTQNTKSYQICTKTVIDSNLPDVSFDGHGISSVYWDFEKNVKPNWFPNEEGKRQLRVYVEEIKKHSKGKDFDCILGLSGGVDSSYMLHTMVKEYGLRPLVFHVDGGWNTEMAVSNIHNLVDKLNLDLFTEVINWNEMKDFQLAWFKSGVPHIDIPQDHAFGAVLYKFSNKHKIKYILNGGNIATECVIMPYLYYYWGTDLVHIRDIIKRFGTIPMKTYPFSSVYNHKIYQKFIKGMKVMKPLNFMPYTKKMAVDILEKEYGWKSYGQKHFESRFTRFYEGYWLTTRFNFDVRRNQLSSLILTGQMQREEALEILKNPPFNPETIQEDFDFIATKLGISSDELNHYLNMEKRFYWDYKNDHRKLKIIEKIVEFLHLGRRGGAF